MPLSLDWLSVGALALLVGLVSECISTITLFFWIKRTERRILRDFAGFIDSLFADMQKEPDKYAKIAAPAFKILMASLGKMAMDGIDERLDLIEQLPVSVKGYPVRGPVKLFEYLRMRQKEKKGETSSGDSSNVKSPFG